VRLLFLTRSLNYGGAERQLVELACGLKRAGESVAVATFYGGGSLESSLLGASVPLHVLGKRFRWDLLGFLWRLVSLFRKSQPVILHSYLGTSNILAVATRWICPGMKVVWGVRASNMKLGHYGWLDQFLYWLECRLSTFADLIIVNSNAGLDYATDHGFPATRMVMIHNGIDIQQFCPDPTVRDRLRAEWGIATQECVIGLVGRLDPMKGHKVFLQAAALLKKERSDVRFVCVGDGSSDYRRSLVHLSEQLGLEQRVIWVPGGDDVKAVYNALDILTSASEFGEGFSNVIGEAMACQTPCVVSDVGDAKEIVGDAGLVVRPGEARGIYEAWIQLLGLETPKRAEMGTRARARIVARYSIDRLVADTASALGRLVQSPK
jgi:glycosyltransferase involved in cell wall biosynthesis